MTWRVVFGQSSGIVPVMNDDDLLHLIRRTQPKPEFSASFQREVWARMAIAEQRAWSAQSRTWSDSFFRWGAQPAPAVAVVIGMLALGVSLGSLVTPAEKPAELRTAYVASINPLTAANVARPK